MRFGFSWLIGICAALLLVGGEAAAQTKLILQAGFPAPSISLGPVYAAQGAGFFAKEGLDLDIRFSSGGAQAAQIVASGGADTALITLEPMIQGYDKGIRGKGIYTYYTRLPYFIAVPADSPVKTLVDLKGKKIGVSNMASVILVVTKSALHDVGVNVGEDAFLPVGVGDSALVAMRSGQVQALSLWDAIYGGMERSGVALRYFYHPTMANFGNGVFFVSDRGLAEKTAAFAGFARAVAKGTALYLDDPAAALKLYWKANPAAKIGGDEAEARQKGMIEIRFMAKTFTLDNVADKRYGATDMAGVKNYVELFRKEGLVQESIPASTLITDQFIDDANRFDPAEIKAAAAAWQ